MDNLEKIGKFLEGSEGRDAVHIAILPATSEEILSPATRVGLLTVGEKLVTVSARKTPYLGVVDPFLPTRTKLGDRFWVFLFPQTITSLRHVWTHPALPDEG